MGLDLGLSLSLTGEGRAAPIDPLTLSPSVWYDPSNLSSMFQDTAGTVAAVVDSPVARINDLSGNARHLLQATAANQPLLKQSGSIYWLDFDGTDDVVANSASFTVSQPDTLVAAVLVEDAPADIGNIFDSNNLRQILGAHGPNYRIFAGTANVKGGTRDASAHVLYGFFSGASSTIKVDGTQVVTGDPGTGAHTGALYLGSSAAATDYFDGRFFGGGIIPRALTAAEEAGLFSHLAAKSGI